MTNTNMEPDNTDARKKRTKRILLIINVLILSVGHCGGPMIMRLYYLHGGKRVWLSSWLLTAGWPINFIPLIVTYLQRRCEAALGGREPVRAVLIDRQIFLWAAVVGVLTGADDYLYAYGVARLPVTTTALIIASQLAFTALFAFLLVSQKFTAFSINAVFLLTVGAGVLALRGSSDRPKGESSKEYYLGFLMTVAAAVLYGFVLPLVELTYKKARQAITYTLVLEIQLVMCFFATVVCTVGMLVNNDFKGGKRVWLSSALETAGWPLNIFPLVFTYMSRRRQASRDGASAKLVLMDFRIFLAAAVVGVLTGLDDFMYASGVSRLPVSTSQLIIASQLGFTALFAFLLVRQKFTSFTVNAVFLLTLGAAVLAIGTGTSRPDGESNKEYYLGFGMVVLAAVLYGFVLPLVELIYARAKQPLTYTLVLEIQLVMCFFATAFCGVGMIINKDFQAIPREAREYGYGVAWYYVVLFLNALLWQCFFLGAIGVVFCASSLLSAILIAVGLPVTEVLAVIFYKEKFSTEKGLSLVLSLWGFVSYFYGEMKLSKSRKRAKNAELELPQIMETHAS